MAFTLQNDDGDVSGANAYISVAEYKEYCDDRGISYVAYTDEQIQIGIVKATDYIDIRFDYWGQNKSNNQNTEFPKADHLTILAPVKEAAAEYTKRALVAELVSDPEFDDVGKVKSFSEGVGPLSEKTEYFEYAGEEIPVYPIADRKLIKAGLVKGSVGALIR